MERKSCLSRNLKHHSLGKLHHHHQHHNHFTWDNCSSESSTSTAGDYLVGGRFSWPPRSYSCSFCRREFRSAQALGGHMNVHRRDRARLRQSPPPPPPSPKDHSLLNLNLHPNPNPNPNISSSSSLPSPSLSVIKKGSGDRVDLAKMKTEKTLFGVREFEGFAQEKKGRRLRLDLEIGIGIDSKEDLDLELRLGYSN